jgi:hypothetical protein
MARRKRGGQPGNVNALKHGFYSHTFRNEEREDLEALMAQGVEEEIALLRVYIRRVAEIAEKHEQEGADPLDKAIHVMSAVGMASLQLGSLLRVQKILGKGGDDVAETISQALTEVLEELREGEKG